MGKRHRFHSWVCSHNLFVDQSIGRRCLDLIERDSYPSWLGMALEEAQLRSIIESLLLISPDPIPEARLVEVIRIEVPEIEVAVIKTAIAQLLEDYQNPERTLACGFRVEDVVGGLQLRTVAENAQFVRRFLAAKPQRLTKAALETLSIVAYRQPVTKAEIEAVRGVDAGAALRSLLERELVKIIGKKDEIGRPIIYGTTPYFLDFFCLKSLNELPTLKEFHELDEASLEEASSKEGAPSVQELAEAAQFLVEREADPDLEALDAAVKAADAVKAATKEALEPSEAPEAASTAGDTSTAAEATTRNSSKKKSPGDDTPDPVKEEALSQDDRSKEARKKKPSEKKMEQDEAQEKEPVLPKKKVIRRKAGEHKPAKDTDAPPTASAAEEERG
ncbi:MAG: SMC-Scp complex subunit ScpB [Myxococcales bacterium]|nr:SMC-Scp complex subunit ScpB [Myxococcales bacterium]